MYKAGDVRINNVPDASIINPTDALVRVTRACICGSDLWPYKAMEPSETGVVMGHEAIGVVEDVGEDVRNIKRGDFVIMPFAWSDGTCEFCAKGLQTACVHGGFFGNAEVAGAQAEAVRIPLADGTLFSLPVAKDDALMASLLTLSDVMGTGHHAAVTAKVEPGKITAVVGDGAVGLCGVIAARRLGAEQIIMLGHHRDRVALAEEFGATEVVKERGAEAVERVLEITSGLGAHSVLECVGLEQSTARHWASFVPAARSVVSAYLRTQRFLWAMNRSIRTLPSRVVLLPCVRTLKNFCPTSSKAGLIPAASLIAR